MAQSFHIGNHNIYRLDHKHPSGRDRDGWSQRRGRSLPAAGIARGRWIDDGRRDAPRVAVRRMSASAVATPVEDVFFQAIEKTGGRQPDASSRDASPPSKAGSRRERAEPRSMVGSLGPIASMFEKPDRPRRCVSSCAGSLRGRFSRFFGRFSFCIRNYQRRLSGATDVDGLRHQGCSDTDGRSKAHGMVESSDSIWPDIAPTSPTRKPSAFGDDR